MVTDLSTPRSTNALLLAATKGEAAAVEALYTHYRQFGTDVAAEHGCDDPKSVFDQAFVEAMADSLDLSQGEPGSFATYLEGVIQGLSPQPEAPDNVEIEGEAIEIEIDEDIEDGDDTEDGGNTEDEDEGVELAQASITDDAIPLGVLPLAATASRPRTPNQLLDRLHPRSVVTVIAAAFLFALIAWVFLESTSSSSDTPTDVVTEPTE